MKKLITKFLAPAIAGLALSMTSLTAGIAAEAIQLGDLKIENAWTRATPPNAKVGGGYLTITNVGSAADRLVSGSSEIAGKVEFHDMKIENGVMKMRPLSDGLEIPPGESVKLAPGGMHVMFMKLTGPLKKGEMVKATLTFEKAGSVDVMFPIAAIGASSAENYKHGHGSKSN